MDVRRRRIGLTLDVIVSLMRRAAHRLCRRDPRAWRYRAPWLRRRSLRCEGRRPRGFRPANRCWFAARVLEVRCAYELTIDRREAAALDRICVSRVSLPPPSGRLARWFYFTICGATAELCGPPPVDVRIALSGMSCLLVGAGKSAQVRVRRFAAARCDRPERSGSQRRCGWSAVTVSIPTRGGESERVGVRPSSRLISRSH